MLELVIYWVFLQVEISHIDVDWQARVNVCFDSSDLGKVFLVAIHIVFLVITCLISYSRPSRPQIHAFEAVGRKSDGGRILLTK